MKREINGIEGAPQAIGPYSQACQVDSLIFLSGQIGVSPQSGKLVEGIDQQTNQALDNISAILNNFGCDFSSLVKVTIFLADMGNYQQVNQIYSERLGASRPARSTVEVSKLPAQALIEIEVVAHSSK